MTTTIVWDATWPPTPRRVRAAAWAHAFLFHYARLAIVATTGRDVLK